jgi:hypothetical protein
MHLLLRTLLILLTVATCVFTSNLYSSVFFKAATTIPSDETYTNSISKQFIGKDGSLYSVLYVQKPSFTLGNNTYSNINAATSCMVVKFSTRMKLVWIQSFAIQSQQVYCNDVQFDTSDNIYVVVRFSGGSLQVGNKTFTTSTGKDIAIVKMSSDGSIVWSTYHENEGNSGFRFILCSDNSIFYVASSKVKVVNINSQPIYTATNYLSGKTYSVFVKLRLDGELDWVKAMDTAKIEQVTSFLNSDSIFIGGNFEPSTTFTIDGTNFTSATTKDIILFKLKLSDGSLGYINSISGDKQEGIVKLLGSDNSIWVLGESSSSTLYVNGTKYASGNGSTDIFYIK